MNCSVIQPVRIQLKSTKGFRLQDVSRAMNGLPAKKVDRATPWGNQYRWEDHTKFWAKAFFHEYLLDSHQGGLLLARARIELAGYNLSCWCALDEPCHADVWLEMMR